MGVEVPGFTLHEVIGRGGFAVVHRATQVSVDRVVAVKLIDTAGLGETAIRRFRAETRAVGSLSWHPHVVSVYDAGTLPDDTAYLAMDYLPDGTFADRVRRDGSLPIAEAVAVGRQLCDALGVAHEAGIVHRDVKPENVMVGRRGDAQLADFGIATLSDSTRSATGSFIGTVAYSAPELLKGSRADVRSDVFSIGATLHAFLSGRSPFVGEDDETAAAVMWRVMSEEPRPLPAGVPAALRDVIASCLAKDPAARPPTAAAVDAALAAIPTGTATPAPPPPPPPPPPSLEKAEAPRAFPPPPMWTMDGPPIPPPPAAPPPPLEETTPDPVPPVGDLTVTPAPPPAAPRRGRGRILVLAAIVLLVAAIAGAALALGGGGDDDPAEATGEESTTTTERETTTTEDETTTTTEPERTTTTTTPTAAEVASAVPRDHFTGTSDVAECTGWIEGYDCSVWELAVLDISCVGGCTATVWGVSVPLTNSPNGWRGEVTGADVGTECEGTPTRATVTILFTVGEAVYSFEQWRAETISGQARVTLETAGTTCREGTTLVGFDLRQSD